MAYVVRMPNLGVEMEKGTVIAWYVDVDVAVSEGDVVAEIESEKSTAEVAAREGGVLREVYLEADDKGPPGAPMGILAGADEDIAELKAQIVDEFGNTSDDGTSSAADSDVDANVDASAGDIPTTGGVSAADGDGDNASASPSTSSETVAATTAEGTVKATPKAKARGRELGVNVATVQGSGVQDSVTASDVKSAAGAGDVTRTVRETREFTGIRHTIAERLGASYREAVHVTVDRGVDVEPVFATADEAGVSIMDVILRGISGTLSEHPGFNARFDADDETHTLYEEHNIGIAIDVEDGLVTPVLSDVESKDLEEISTARSALTERALDGEYTSSNLSGGTFTVSNLGVFGSDSFTPIINPPEVAILGVNRVTERPVRTDRDIEFRRHITFSLTFDHRVVDGADAARFLTTLDEQLITLSES